MNRYALLGHKLSHSQSKIIHEYFFEKNGIDAEYELLEIEENEILDKLSLLRNGYYNGFNVTIPYKETVMKFLDVLSPAAKEIGAVNTIYLKDGLLVGDNTDYLGFIDELNKFDICVEGKNVYVLGSGGASKGIRYALKLLKANPIVVSRSSEKGLTYDELKQLNHIDVVVNTTPVGMYPNIDGEILDKDTVKKIDICIDLICNPKQTKLLQYSKEGYCGIMMLICQALHAEKLWGNDIEIDILDLYKKL